MRNIDFSSWEGVLTTLIGIALLTLIGVGIRLLFMATIQRRRERLNRQINERLRTLIAAYKVLGGSFTGNLTVNPTHLREKRHQSASDTDGVDPAANAETAAETSEGSDRQRRVRDAVEAALSDIILLGTEAQVRLADQAARDLVAGRVVHTHDLVVSLRDFIRQALDLDPIPKDIAIPAQGPTRPASTGGRGRSERTSDETRQGRGGGGAGGTMGGGGGLGTAGMGAVLGGGASGTSADNDHR